MPREHSRTELVLGAEGLRRLRASRVAVIGLGGVGSAAAEALARSGVGALLLVDHDTVCVTNLNRQLVAARSTVGRPKAEVMRERVLDIDPAIRVEALREYYKAETGPSILDRELDFIVDAIDSVPSKLDLIVRAQALGIGIVSSMGAGCKLDPTRVTIADISETSICPLARIMRKELRRLGVERLQVVFSREPPLEAAESPNPCLGCPEAACPKRDERWSAPRAVPGSVSFVPPAFGLAAASAAVRSIIQGARRDGLS
jgi:tRNA A37 threonylcarbamoyladenosine dehydratase